MHLPRLSVIEAPRSVQGGGMPLMSTRVTPAVCMAGGTRIEMPASFVVTFCPRGDADHVFQSPYQITVDRYRVIAAGASVSAETRKQ